MQHEKGSSVDKLKLKHSPLKKIPKLVIVELGLSQNIKSVGIEKGFLGGVIVVSNFFCFNQVRNWGAIGVPWGCQFLESDMPMVLCTLNGK